MKKPFLTLLALGALALAGSSSVHAQALLLNFGSSNALNPTLNTAANNPAGIAGGTFNTILGNKTSAFVFSDGSAAAGLTLDVGNIRFTTPNYFFNAAPTAGTSFSQANTGIYAAGTPASNSSYINSGYGLGAVINGLATGTYNVYLVGIRAANGAASVSQMDFAQAITPPTFDNSVDVDITGYGQALQTNNAAYSPSAFALGSNYQLLTVTVGAGQSLFVGSQNNGTNTSFLNLVEIVPVTVVPEPSTWAAAGIGALMIAAKTLSQRRARA